MATPLLQKARQRKMIYFGVIVALFTLSLIHREFVIKPQATRLQLRETVRGEVELTSSAVRLMLTGSRGVAVTMLWYNAMEKQRRSEWNELELIVKSITKLQPYFITPWLYQSWNISFNVAVESDRPRDKYYYVSRGLELLAEGERRNSGSAPRGAAADPDALVIPGNPELRHFMGFIYQLKYGNSDERLTMRSLLEMSCIDPQKRNPDKFWTTSGRGQKGVNLVELSKFCQKHPRLVRRLHEQLGLSDPQHIVQFLQDHRNIPNRFKPIDASNSANIEESELKDTLDQFPILPPHEGNWPDPELRDMTSESVDVFLVSRTWYQYAQKPLPPADREPEPIVPIYDKLKYRVPKGMVIQLFRQYPARAQVFIAETLDSEGFFDSEGWDMSPKFKKWGNLREAKSDDYTFGADSKYYARGAWQRGFEMYKEFGYKNGIYIPPDDLKALEAEASIIRKKYGLKPDDGTDGKPEWREGPMRKSFDAHKKLHLSGFYRHLCNFDNFFYQSEAECDPITVAMRKHLFRAERKRKREPASPLTAELYDEAYALYTHASLKFPRFSQVTSVQEEVYEIQLKALKEVNQKLNIPEFRNAALAAALVGSWQVGNVPALMDPVQPAFLALQRMSWAANKFDLVRSIEDKPQEMLRIMPIRNRYGSLALIEYYDAPGTKELKEEFLHKWIQGAGLAINMSVPQALAFPNGHEYYLLSRSTPYATETVPANWKHLIETGTRALMASRLGMDR